MARPPRPTRALAGAVVVAVLAAVALAWVGALPSTAEDRACTPRTDVRHDLAYGSHRLQRLDVYPAPADACGQNPVLVWVHGGGWRRGDKANGLADKVAWAHANGWTLVSVNYRLSTPNARPPVRYPDHNRDVGRAVEWVHARIARFGGDPDRIALMGHSAGAGIVAAVGADERNLDDGTRPTVSCVAALDTEAYDIEHVIDRGGRVALLYRNAFGNRRAVWRDASPVNQVSAEDPDVLLTSRGSLHRRLVQAAYAARLRAAGVEATVVPLVGYSHGDVNTAVGTDQRLTPALTTFFAGCFAP